MSVHAFESFISLPVSGYILMERAFEDNPRAHTAEYLALRPTFDIAGRATRIGEIAFTHVTEDEFAGVVYVDCNDFDKYEKLLAQAGMGRKNIDQVPSNSFNTHLIAGKRFSDSPRDFMTTSVVRSNMPKAGQITAERLYRETASTRLHHELRIQPTQVYQIAAALRTRRRAK